VIDLVPGTKPIYISPYWISSVELKELKEQLENLLRRGLFSLYIDSPWGTSFLFVKKKDSTIRMCIDY